MPRGVMRPATWNARTTGYLSTQGKHYANTLRGMTHIWDLRRKGAAPREAARILEESAEEERLAGRLP